MYLMRKFEPVALFKAVDDYRITHLPVVPPILIMLAKHPMVPYYDFSSVRELLCGAAPLQHSVSFTKTLSKLIAIALIGIKIRFKEVTEKLPQH